MPPCELSGSRELKTLLSSITDSRARLHGRAGGRLEFQATDATFIYYEGRNYYGLFEKRSHITNINISTNFKKFNVLFIN